MTDDGGVWIKPVRRAVAQHPDPDGSRVQPNLRRRSSTPRLGDFSSVRSGLGSGLDTLLSKGTAKQVSHDVEMASPYDTPVLAPSPSLSDLPVLPQDGTGFEKRLEGQARTSFADHSDDSRFTALTADSGQRPSYITPESSPPTPAKVTATKLAAHISSRAAEALFRSQGQSVGFLSQIPTQGINDSSSLVAEDDIFGKPSNHVALKNFGTQSSLQPGLRSSDYATTNSLSFVESPRDAVEKAALSLCLQAAKPKRSIVEPPQASITPVRPIQGHFTPVRSTPQTQPKYMSGFLKVGPRVNSTKNDSFANAPIIQLSQSSGSFTKAETLTPGVSSGSFAKADTLTRDVSSGSFMQVDALTPGASLGSFTKARHDFSVATASSSWLVDDSPSSRNNFSALYGVREKAPTAEEKYLKKLNRKLLQMNLLDESPGRAVHIFVDMSNIFIGLEEKCREERGIRKNQYFHIDPKEFLFRRLHHILARNRLVGKKSLAGSVATPAEKLYPPAHFSEAEKLDYKVSIMVRVMKIDNSPNNFRRTTGVAAFPPPVDWNQLSGDESSDGSPTTICPRTKLGEQGVDENLHLAMQSSIIDTADPENGAGPGVMVLATGDAKEAEFSEGFAHFAVKAIRMGWHIEVVSWKRCLSSIWKKSPFTDKYTSQFRIIELDPFYEDILAGKL
ncbi:hypothetical protein PG990_014952 [Apiospora arundinis]